MEYKVYTKDDELYHWGIKGMKWGVRRYQNEDGSLTPSGKKRRSLGEVIKDHRIVKKRKAALEKARQTKLANKQAAEKRAKDVEAGKIKSKDMTEAELNARISRLNLEKTYNDALRNSKQTTMGSRFTSKFKESLVDKLADNVGADLISQVAKSFGAEMLNAVAQKMVPGSEKVFANNKKKA